MSPDRTSVTLLGVGITSIMVALRLVEENCRISVYTKGPDPRLDRDAEQHGATGNGRSARFVTGLEGKPHFFDGSVLSDAIDQIHTPLSGGGWLSKPRGEYSDQDQEWLRNRHAIAKDQSHIDSLYDKYVGRSRESLTTWLKLREQKPQLFKDADATDPSTGVLVLCGSQELLDSTTATYRKHNFLKEALTGEDVSRRFPVYENAYQSGQIVGGILAEGFAFNIHQFIDNAISKLEAKGVKFFWNETVTGIETNDSGDVIGLRTAKGQLVTSIHYSINPGAYGNDILKGTPAENRICGVAGRWLIIPRPDNFAIPTKILTSNRFGSSIGDNNLTPFTENGRKMLAVSGGSVYTGSDHMDLPTPDVCQLIDAEIERIVQLYLGRHYEKLKRSREITPWSNTCLRSFTHDDNPVHETMKTVQGGTLTITAGTNTGTTALAPHLAEWTAETLMKRS